MLNVTFEKDGMELTLKVEGHAGQATMGQDIICSACSILAYTVAQLVTNAKEEGDLKLPPVISMESGDAIVSCIPTEEAYDTIYGVYLFASVGYKLLAHSYPQYVEIKPFGTE